MSSMPSPSGVAVLRDVAQALNRDLSPDGNLRAAMELLARHLPLLRATLWRRSPGSGPMHMISAPFPAEPAASFEELPPAPAGTIRMYVAHAGNRLGLLELVPSDALRPGLDPEVCQAVGEILAPYLDAVLLSEGLAEELATRAREIREQRRFTNLIIDSLPVGLYVVDREYRIRVWNRKRETGTQGLQRDQVIGRPVFEVLTRQSPEELRSEIDEIFAHGEVVQRELDVISGGEPRVYRLTKVPMRLDGLQISHVITIGEDVTERRTTEQRILQSDKLAALGQLAAGVMHEINNPLATIGACVAAIEARIGESADETAREYLEIIDTEVQRCSRIVDRLLEFSRPARSEHERRPEDLNVLVAQTLFLLKHHARFKRLVVERTIEEDLPAVLVEGERIIQAFMAIMLNAADAMESGGTLRVRTGRNPVREDEAVVEFTDTGEGIPEGEISRIFEPFFSTKAPGRGTGLGLTISYGIIEEQGGRITVDSRPGVGTTFRVFLPIAQEATG